MKFSNELTSFPSAVHKIIYAAARDLAPLEYSLGKVEDITQKYGVTKASCEAFHDFLQDLFSDMYDFPEAYHLPVYELENYLGGKKEIEMKRKFPSKTKRIISYTRNVVHGYMLVLGMLGLYGTVQEEHLVIPSEIFPIIEKRVNSPTSPIALEQRLSAMARVGFICEGNMLNSKKHPLMFPALCALAHKMDNKLSGFSYFLFSNCDFRNLKKNYKPTYEDYFRPLVRERWKQAMSLHQIAIEHGCKPTINTFWKVDYKYKGVQVMCIDTLEGDMDIRVTETYNWDDANLINKRLEKETPEFQTYALRNLWRCNGCSTSHLGCFVTVLGKRQRVCGGGIIGFKWRNPVETDIEIIGHMIGLRCEIIDEMKQLENQK